MGGSKSWFFTAENVRKPLFKKNLITVLGVNHQKLSLKRGVGGVGDNCFPMLFDFVSHVPKRFPLGSLHAPGEGQMLAG